MIKIFELDKKYDYSEKYEPFSSRIRKINIKPKFPKVDSYLKRKNFKQRLHLSPHIWLVVMIREIKTSYQMAWKWSEFNFFSSLKVNVIYFEIGSFFFKFLMSELFWKCSRAEPSFLAKSLSWAEPKTSRLPSLESGARLMATIFRTPCAAGTLYISLENTKPCDLKAHIKAGKAFF